ncbi:hypothetical protein EVAR_33934_1 [Eumeta japonica]|uniref:Uncharacterized protein n=1 Tax=Eumeta variegata TaxID=151549 RepID=A0A4C1VVZ5_EUMVA|nr:hypothetical protein EVAR_33934_1 [Eumeta japonica]
MGLRAGSGVCAQITVALRFRATRFRVNRRRCRLSGFPVVTRVRNYCGFGARRRIMPVPHVCRRLENVRPTTGGARKRD